MKWDSENNNTLIVLLKWIYIMDIHKFKLSYYIVIQLFVYSINQKLINILCEIGNEMM